MSKSKVLLPTVAVVVLGAAAIAWAQEAEKKTLYIRAKNTRVFASSSFTAAQVGMLQPGAEVTWLGADATNKKWHKISAQKTKGVVYQSNLSPVKPQQEFWEDKGGEPKPLDAIALESAGAAIRGVAPGAVQIGTELKLSEVLVDLQTLKAIAAQTGTKEIADHSKRAKLIPVVAP